MSMDSEVYVLSFISAKTMVGYLLDCRALFRSGLRGQLGIVIHGALLEQVMSGEKG